MRYSLLLALLLPVLPFAVLAHAITPQNNPNVLDAPIPAQQRLQQQMLTEQGQFQQTLNQQRQQQNLQQQQQLQQRMAEQNQRLQQRQPTLAVPPPAASALNGSLNTHPSP